MTSRRADPGFAFSKFGTPIFWVVALAIGIGSFQLRMRHAGELRDGASIRFHDIDTMRRLARIDALAGADTYPVVERLDGFPGGTVSHWTRPFDWFLCALDPVAAPFVAGARVHEAAAVLAGPVLGTLAVLVFLWGAVRLLGRWPGALATVFYALQNPTLTVSAVGNGDHQNLQHLAVVGFVLLWLLGHAGRGRWVAAPLAGASPAGAALPGATPAGASLPGASPAGAVLAGAALGFSIWVSTETMVLLLLWIGITALLMLFAPRDELRARANRELAVGGGLLAALFTGLLFEHADLLAFEWDKVSWFQIYPVLTFLAFLSLIRLLPDVRGRAAIAAAGGLGLGLLVLFGSGLEATVRTELARFDEANVWLQAAVSEFRSSFRQGAELALAPALHRFGYLFLLLPVFLAGVWAAKSLAPAARAILIGATAATFGLAAWEAKLSHLFAIWFPLAAVAGTRALGERFLRTPRGRTVLDVALLALFVTCGCLTLPGKRGPTPIGTMLVNYELTDWLRTREGADTSSVLAQWDRGGAIMYLAKWPVVASGYHRNIAGIRDGYRVYTSQPDEAAIAAEILARRKVRYVVVSFNRYFLYDAQRVLGLEQPLLTHHAGTQVEFSERATHTLFWRLRSGERVPGFRHVYRSRYQNRANGNASAFDVFEVVRR